MRAALVAIVVALTVMSARADARTRTATGYAHGEKTKLKLVDVGGAEVEVRTAKAYRAMVKAARKAGVALAIRSGYRTHAKQKKLYNKYRRGEGNLAARPGYSVHESGRALDLVITEHKTYAWLEAHASQFGFHRTVPGEPWHWEFVRGSEGTRTAVERGQPVAVAPAEPAVEPAGEVEDYAEREPCTRDWPGR